MRRSVQGTNTEARVAMWETPQCPYRIECPVSTLEEIRLNAIEAFYSLPRGGMEIGGVLFGSRADDCIRITATRGVNCEHAYGPGYTLSPKDQAALTHLLDQATRDPALKSLEPVGWYHSHTRSEICLSTPDLELYDKFFPEKWQVALVVRPTNMQATRGGFFFREGEGKVHATATYKEFVMEPAGAATIVEARPAAMAAAAHAVRRQADVSVAPALVAAAPSTVKPIVPPAFFVNQNKKRHRRLVMSAFGLLMAAGLAGAGYQTKSYWLPARPDPIGLELMDVEGQLLVRWNRTNTAIQNAPGGVLEIKDGEKASSVSLDPVRLKSGGYRFERASERVDLRMIVPREGGKSLEETASFVGALPVHAPTPEEMEAQKRRQQAEEEAAKIKTDLQNQNVRTRRLERTLADMRKQLQDQRTRPQPTPAQ